MNEALSTPEEHFKEWCDLLSGLSLLYMGPKGSPDELITRGMWHMQSRQIGGMEHIASLLITQLLLRATPAPQFAREKWSRLSREYHERFCTECGDPDE